MSKAEYLQVEMTCDICGNFTATAREVGAHVSHTHYDELVTKVLDKIVESGRKGITRPRLEAVTGWSSNRIASITKTLERQGIVVSNNRRPLRYYDASVKAKTKVRQTKGGGAVVSVERADVNLPATDALLAEANRKAMVELAKRHPDEFRQLFANFLMESNQFSGFLDSALKG